MKVKRLITSLTASFDQFVAQVENHEAVADSLLDELGHSAAQIKIQIKQISARKSRVSEQLAKSKSDIENWKRRALKTRDSDEETALKCVRAMQNAEQQFAQLRQQENEIANLKSQMETQLQDVEKKLSHLKMKKQSLKARQVRNKSAAAFQSIDSSNDIDQVFERWEQNVVAGEYQTDYNADDFQSNSEQTLEKEFLQVEERENLHSVLHALDQNGEGE